MLTSGAVLCTLRCRIGEAWVSHQDVGVPSKMEPAKSATSDSLKRASRKVGIGAYLVNLGGQWLDYNPTTKRITGRPTLPAWAMPAGEAGNGPPAAAKARQAAPKAKANPLPKDGPELERRLAAFDAELTLAGVIMDGDLLANVSHAVAEAGFGLDVRCWSDEAIRIACDAAKKFEVAARAK
jgi:hypothetical protein